MTGTGRERPLPTTVKRTFTLFGKVVTLVAGTTLAAGCGLVAGVTGGSGDQPVTVMTWAPVKTAATNQPGMPAVANAYARWVNANGGLDGHPLKVLTCNDHNDSVGAAKCARKAVDQHAVAVVGSYSQYGRSFMSTLESAGIPYIGGYGVSESEFTSPLSYPVNGGQAALLAGNGQQLADKCARTVLVRPDTVAGDELVSVMNTGLARRDRPAATDLRAAEDATDYNAQAVEALSTASAVTSGEGCVVAALGERTNTFFDSFRRLSDTYPKVRTASVLGSVDQSVIDRSGGAKSAYEGAYVTGWYPATNDSRWDGMKKAINEKAFGDNRIDPADAGVQTTWIAYTVLRQVVEAIGDGEVTSDTVRRTLDKGLKVTTGGLTPALRWDYDHMSAAGGYPRLVNARVTFQQVRDGRLVATRSASVDVTKTLADAD
ncbi:MULTISPECIES: ABC transporter substrate-binding protein [unclassified Streptomyces]|uniref:ABC transporter substrate-binding protein n=1 Tax=unclassified Streptomyces TaxID=2593676 RepID=UPI000DBA1401|nr:MULTISPECIES: ABC transporter substrate-binding protein [unclassified Streptomyces]MYT72124.1 ABC transporter substrate-binding protein [Streptomyces sp. SID8367]RAJ81535.1 ABC-type branched-subunit amino acid transport system substrate-binding protein [Streptomyces sp. PsTaAH-137]